MAKCKEISATACPDPFECWQRHVEFLLVDDKGNEGKVIEKFCRM